MLDGLRARLREEGDPPAERRARQDAANPAYVPRNAVMQDAIRAAEAGSFDEVRCRACPNVASWGCNAVLANPAYVPRNMIMQDVICAIEAGSYDEVRLRARMHERGLLGLRCGIGTCLSAGWLLRQDAPPGMFVYACWGSDAVLGYACGKLRERPGRAVCPDTGRRSALACQPAACAADADRFLRSGAQLHALMAVLERPYTQQPGAERFTRTERKVRMGVELLSCSS